MAGTHARGRAMAARAYRERAWWVGACVGARTERECWTSGGVWWLGLVVGFDFAEVSQFCFFLVSFSFLGEYVLVTYVGGIADAMLCEIELFSFLFFSFPNTFFLLQILFFFSKYFFSFAVGI